tara:strand:- start:668 stop:811 length:144 start_codon:yes stop_codon:yes gene_type:complete
LDVYVQSVVSSYNWSIKDVLLMYTDAIDFEGLQYWYDVLKKEKPKDK